VVIASNRATYCPDHSRWTFWASDKGIAAKTSIRTSASVGMLLTSREVSGYEGFYGVGFGVDAIDARLGVVIRSGSATLGHVVMQVDCKGHGFTEAPTAIVRIVRTSIPSNPPPPSLIASVFAWEGEQAFISFSGSLESGDNIVLLTPSNVPSEPTLRLLADPMNLTAPPATPADGGQGGPDCNPVCIPPPVGSGNTCAPPAPESRDGCAAPTPQGAADCKGDSTPVGMPACGYQGASATLTGTIGVTGSVSTGWSIGSDTTGLEVSQTYTGSISGAFAFSLGIVNQNGHGGCASCNGGLDMCGTCSKLAASWNGW
jgi:hypothetical protein